MASEAPDDEWAAEAAEEAADRERKQVGWIHRHSAEPAGDGETIVVHFRRVLAVLRPLPARLTSYVRSSCFFAPNG